jgi:glycosyltransferase involved in cell wall biosynthesis
VADEIIVIHDGPCADRSLAIAEEYGAKIIVGEHYGYMEPHLVRAYEEARGQWLLRIDADEFLSQELRAALPGLLNDTQVAAYEFAWPLFNGRQYLTKTWPRKCCLFRKDKISFLSLPDAATIVHGTTKSLDYRLEHQPLVDNYALKLFSSRWLRLARIRADLYMSSFQNVLRFNSTVSAWPRAFRWRQRFPLLVLPFDFLVTFLRTLSEGWSAGAVVLRVALMAASLRAAVDWLIFRKH